MQAHAGARASCRKAASSGASRRTCVVRASTTAVPTQFKAVKPVGDRVLVKVDKEEAKTQGGVLLPSIAQTKPTAGSIVGVGSVEFTKAGDRVVYSKYAGTEVALGDQEHVLLKEEDVIGVLPEGDKIAKLKPLGDRVLIKCAQAASTSSGGVLLASTSDEKPTFGEVIAVGEGRKGEDGEVSKPNVAVGSTVMYSKYSGTEFDEDDDSFIVVRESDILAALS